MAIDTNILQQLYQRKQSEIKYNLNNILQLSRVFDHPERKLKIFHITGTNGKGSVAAILESLILSHGYKVGLFTSPHLVNYNERFRINQRNIDDKKLIFYIKKVVKKANKYNIKASFFELSTIIALLYFSDENVDYAILEVGLGGRLDATNIVKPLISIITMIDLEHRRLLGNNKTLIAKEKAGIIKKGSLFFTGEQSPRIKKVILTEGIKKGGILAKKFDIKIKFIDETLSYQRIALTIGDNSIGIIKFPLLGKHQLFNLKVALNSFLNIFPDVDTDKLIYGLEHVKWLGRLSLINKKPIVMIDGAHNRSGTLSLQSYLKNLFSCHNFRKKYLLFGMVRKKPLPFAADHLFSLFDMVLISNFENERARDLKDYIIYLKKNAKNFIIFNSMNDAIEYLTKVMEPDDFLIVSGSLYLLGDFLKKESIWVK